jgi:thiosulfate/3-mercaptopyruvate sulfurtransferase
VSACLLATLVALVGCQPDTSTYGPGSIVTVDWLSQNTADSTIVPIHVGSEAVFNEEHIPRASYLSFADFAIRNDSATGLRNELPPPDAMRQRLEALGVSDDSKIVVYSDNERTLFATRLLFTLDYLGLGEQSFLLDGGLVAWKAAGYPVTADLRDTRPGSLSAKPVNELVVDADWIAARMSTPGHVLVDARPHEQYAGTQEQTESRQGHIPGAVNLPLTELYDQSGKMRHAAELERLFQHVGFTPGDTVVAYCVTGVLATGVTYAARHLGYEIRVYDGSIEDWSADPDRPLNASHRPDRR